MKGSADALQVVVIGGGAAGFFGAIACAEIHPHAQITLLEAARQPLAKVRISGGGRCNVTHACFDPAALIQNYPRGGRALRGAFTRFQAKDTVEWFTRRGVRLKTEADGRMFPVTDNSETIVQCLMQVADIAGVQLRLGVPVQSVSRHESGFQIELKSSATVSADRLLLATGSNPRGYAIAEALGHAIEPPVPSLFTFNIRDARLQDLAGISVPTAHLRLQVGEHTQLEQTGALLITHWGFSGPAVLKLSAWGARALHDNHYQGNLTIHWLPQFKPDELRQHLLQARTEMPRKLIAAHSPLSLPRRLWERLVASAGIQASDRWAELSNKALHQLLQELTRGEYHITGKGVFKEEFVTCGGISLKQVDFKTMSSRCCPHLYFAGEILDIDGITGGFNFQSAWTTGWIAGQAMGNR
jgi:predicted Rossmann fold flavoprotein